MPKLQLISLATLLLSLMGVACASSSTLTLTEYAEWCGNPQESLNLESDLSAGGTWGEVTEAVQVYLDAAQAIEAPEEVKAYHSGQIQVAQAFVAFGKDQDPDELFSPFSLIGVGLLVTGIIESAEASLSDQVRSTLEDAGCLDSDQNTDEETTLEPAAAIDRDDPARIGERISIHRLIAEDSFDMIVHGQPKYSDGYYRIDVTVIATVDEWAYDQSIFTGDQIQLVSIPDNMGRIYKLSEVNSFYWDEPPDALNDVILITGGQHRGALYFSGDAPANVQWAELLTRCMARQRLST